MKSRLAASVVLSAAVLVSATGCTFITPQASTISYSASDGVNVSDAAGPLSVRNAMVITDETGQRGNLVAGIVNTTSDDLTLHIQTEVLEGMASFEVDVPAGDSVSLGADADPLLLDGLETQAGATVAIHFQSGDGAGELVEVPVLDDALPYYADLVPEEEAVEQTGPVETPAG